MTLPTSAESFVLIERGADRGAQSNFAPRLAANRGGKRAELTQHLALEELGRVPDPETLESTFREIAKHGARFLVEIVERRWRSRRRSDPPPAVAARRFPQC